MGLTNLGVVFGPTLLRSKGDALSAVSDLRACSLIGENVSSCALCFLASSLCVSNARSPCKFSLHILIVISCSVQLSFLLNTWMKFLLRTAVCIQWRNKKECNIVSKLVSCVGWRNGGMRTVFLCSFYNSCSRCPPNIPRNWWEEWPYWRKHWLFAVYLCVLVFPCVVHGCHYLIYTLTAHLRHLPALESPSYPLRRPLLPVCPPLPTLPRRSLSYNPLLFHQSLLTLSVAWTLHPCLLLLQQWRKVLTLIPTSMIHYVSLLLEQLQLHPVPLCPTTYPEAAAASRVHSHRGVFRGPEYGGRCTTARPTKSRNLRFRKATSLTTVRIGDWSSRLPIMFLAFYFAPVHFLLTFSISPFISHARVVFIHR